MSEIEILIQVFIFILGLIVGSFLNVCIVRLPQEKSIVYPSSHCVKCHESIPWYDNIPVLSFLFLGGKCRFCKEKISLRYMLVEILTGIVFLIFYQQYQLTLLYLAYVIMISGLIVATFVDFENRIIPDEVSVGGMFVGLVLSCFIVELHDKTEMILNAGRIIMRIGAAMCSLYIMLNLIMLRIKKKEDEDGNFTLLLLVFAFVLIEFVVESVAGLLSSTKAAGVSRYLLNFDASIIGVFIGGGSIYALGALGDAIFKKESMGGGDVKLMAMVGAFVGWKIAILAFFIAPFFGAIYGIIEKIRTKDSAIAYGPFLVMGTLISMYKGDEIIRWILRGYGIEY